MGVQAPAFARANVEELAEVRFGLGGAFAARPEA